jgi:hypothetical protein
MARREWDRRREPGADQKGQDKISVESEGGRRIER